jgi:hypothetical protein
MVQQAAARYFFIFGHYGVNVKLSPFMNWISCVLRCIINASKRLSVPMSGDLSAVSSAIPPDMPSDDTRLAADIERL